MANKWQTTTLGRVASFHNGDRGKNYPKPSDFVAQGIPFINTGHIEPGGRLSLHRMNYISHECFDKLRGGGVTRGDIVYCLRGSTIGKTARVDLDEGTIASSLVIVRALDNSDQDFLYYYLTGPDGSQQARKFDNGSAQPNLSAKMLSGYPIHLPPLAEQKAIVRILGALDDKIELNRRMNETLEAMARAIFKSWFVDFDPVRAKLDGRQPPGMDADTAALFPDHFVHTDLGLAPKGWTIRPVGEVIEAVGGGTPSTKEPTFWDFGKHHWATPKDLSNLNTPILLDTNRKLTDAGLKKVSSGLLPKGTLLLSSRAPVGYLAISEVPVAVNQGFIAMKCNRNASNYFMLNWCRENMDEIERRASGTTFQEISKRSFRPIPMAVPPSQLVGSFDDAVGTMYQRIAVNL
ncbi:MAG: restriction endonuclease subunit S, partial [Planctomycetaceae bacterium]